MEQWLLKHLLDGTLRDTFMVVEYRDSEGVCSIFKTKRLGLVIQRGATALKPADNLLQCSVSTKISRKILEG